MTTYRYNLPVHGIPFTFEFHGLPQRVPTAREASAMAAELRYKLSPEAARRVARKIAALDTEPGAEPDENTALLSQEEERALQAIALNYRCELSNSYISIGVDTSKLVQVVQ